MDLGIWVHWNLPASLREEGELVPNRWLVTAVNEEDSRDVAQWIVESDCPGSQAQKNLAPEGVYTQGAGFLVTPQIMEHWRSSGDELRAQGDIMTSGQTAVCRLGAVFEAGGWQERSGAPLFLTAVAAANPAFSQFVPHCRNIFSIGFLPSCGKASYCIGVFGWYSAPPQGREDTVYVGIMRHVAWDRHGEAPMADPLREIVDSGLLNAAAGNSAYEAFSTMLEQKALPGQEAFVEWLKAVCLDHPEVWKELDGAERLWEYGRKEGFSGQGGSLRYTIVPEKESDGSKGAWQEEAELTQEEEDSLEALNRTRQVLEEEQRKLRQLQRELFGLWWKRKRFLAYPSMDSITDQSFAPYFDSDDPESLLARTVVQWEKVRQCMQTMPKPVCGKGKRIKEIPGEPFYRAGNPTLALLGVKPPSALNHEERYPMEELEMKEPELEGKLGKSRQNGLPAAVDLCVRRFLTEMGAGEAAGNEIREVKPKGGMPSLGLRKESGEAAAERNFGNHSEEEYRVTWEPMYMEWRLSYTHVPLEGNWRFDGKEYVLTKEACNGAAANTEEYSGVSLLSGHAQWTLSDKLKKLLPSIREEAGEEADAMEMFVKGLEEMDLLMVELSGFHENLLQLDNRAFVIPEGETVSCCGKVYSLAGLMGFGGVDPLQAPAVEHAPLMTSDVYNGFYGIRSGQILLEDVTLHDKFGRVLNIISSGERSGLLFDENFEILAHETMKPEYRLFAGKGAYPLEVRPRLMQPARLQVGQKRMESIFLVNYLNHSMEFFSAAGEPLGVLRCSAEGKMQWNTPPGGRGMGRVEEVAIQYPAVGQFIEGLLTEERGSGRFEEFLDIMEETLWEGKGIFRCGKNLSQGCAGLSVMFSKPLAFVTVEVSCLLEDAPCRPQDRKYTFSHGPEDIKDLAVCVCPGNLADAGDGLVGYFTVGLAERMYMVGRPEQEQGFFRQITPEEGFLCVCPGVAARAQEVCLLMDAGLPVHFYTGLLPTAVFSVDGREWEKAAAALEEFHRTGPVLSWVDEADGGTLKLPMASYEDTLRFTFGEEEGWGISALKEGEREPFGEVQIYEGYLMKRRFMKSNREKG